MQNFLYKYFVKPIFFLFDPEFVHNQLVRFGAISGKFGFSRSILKFFFGYKGPDISKTVDGIRYKTPVLLSAGFDYNADLVETLGSIGFGGEEMGSITARPCPGNAPPRLTRLKKNKSIMVNKGLKNIGAEKIIEKLKKKKKFDDFVWGISVARTNDEKAGTIDEGIEDYYYTMKKFVDEGIGDYFTINISCPNAFCGETFADSPELLEQLLTKLKTIETDKPIYVKLPINKPWELIDSLIDVVVRIGINGIVIGNLSKDKNTLEYPEEIPNDGRKGNFSGKPTFKLSNELIKKSRDKYGDKITIIGVGGILTPQDAMVKFDMGADLVQLITGMIFTGPQLISQISYEYAKRNKKN